MSNWLRRRANSLLRSIRLENNHAPQPQLRSDPPADFPEREPDLVIEVERAKLAAQVEGLNALDSKIGVLFGFASTTATAPPAFLSLSGEPVPKAAVLLVLLGGASYLISALFAYLAFKIRKWASGPDSTDLWDYNRDEQYSDGALRWWVAEAYTDSFRKNDAQLTRKAKQAEWAMIAFAGETLFVVAAVAVTLLSS